ncbi:hypothetical protein A0H81_03747 [Grifola frondosa]|uniref:Uncharacterized protein n=1 Tax=Grifola frondosa TaxID=5627 RepID=A0A1C7MHS9_GRIFR|nr:hypothetical protein A0H81_03747 [Grifola frondosa]
MAPQKRKIADLDDSDDEEPVLGKQVLPVANLPDSFHGVPADGLQYLFMVRRDARALPNVTRVTNPYEIPEKNADISVQPSDAIRSSNVLPSEEWRGTFLRRFKNFRKNSTQSTIHVRIPHADTSRRMMPDKKDREAWWAFLTGQPESVWNPPKKPKQSRYERWQQKNDRQGRGMRGFSSDPDGPSISHNFHEADASAMRASAQTWRVSDDGEVELVDEVKPAGSLPTPDAAPEPQAIPFEVAQTGEPPALRVTPEPTPSLMHCIDHRYALHLLMYFTHWINIHLEQPDLALSDFTVVHARWMFNLLSRVDDYISGDEASLLRNLARACMSLIVELKRRRNAKDSAEVSQAKIETFGWMLRRH